MAPEVEQVPAFRGPWDASRNFASDWPYLSLTSIGPVQPSHPGRSLSAVTACWHPQSHTRQDRPVAARRRVQLKSVLVRLPIALTLTISRRLRLGAAHRDRQFRLCAAWNRLFHRMLMIPQMPAGFATMNDAQQPITDYYRETAEHLRQLARVSRLTDIRGDLLELSARANVSPRMSTPQFGSGRPDFLAVSFFPLPVIDGYPWAGMALSALLHSRENWTAFVNAARFRPVRGARWPSSGPHPSDVRTKSKGVRR
jgi:hypothetical protein